MFEQTLYGLDKKGAFKVWTVEVKQYIDPVTDLDTVSLTVRHGSEGGVMTPKQDFNLEGKQGRNSYEQSVFEARAKIKKQMDKNYRATKEELTELPILPMLASDYNKVGHRINFKKGVYLSDKLDGVRMMAKCLKDGTITLESRTGQPYDIPHIVEELKGIMQPGDILDGEAYLHNYILQDITSAVKRTDPESKVAAAHKKMQKAVGDHDKFIAAQLEYIEALMIQELREKLQFVIFAVIEDEFVDQSSPFSEVVISTRMYWKDALKFVKFLHYDLVFTEDCMKLAHKEAVKRGFEGIMIRNADGVNESGKRSADLQKYKEFVDSEFLILDVLPAKDNGSVFLVKNDLNDETFTVTLGSMVMRAEYLLNKDIYIGKYLTVKYQARYKDSLLPQFPTGVQIRNGEVVDGEFVPSE